MNDQHTPNETVTIYTDGACSGNPGPGGWGALLQKPGKIKKMKGGAAETTNNRMELMAAIKALEVLRDAPRKVQLYTDSTYVRDGLTQWLPNWKANGWKTANKKPVKNTDLWQRLDAANQRHDVEWHWVKGHAGNEGNEVADELARQGMAKYLRKGN